MNKLNLFIVFVLLIHKWDAYAKLTPIEDSMNLFQPQLTEMTGPSGGATAYQDLDPQGKCEPLNTDLIQICKNIGYNQTRFPNFMKQRTQQEAASDANLYMTLIKMNCSPTLKMFLCSIYAPPCVTDYTLVRPCREMCEKVRLGCESLMKTIAYGWPPYFDCFRFPSEGNEPCVNDNSYTNSLQSPSSASQQSNSLSHFSQVLQNPNFFSGLNPQNQLLFNTLTNPNAMNTMPSSVNELSRIQNRNYYQFLAAVAAANLRVKFACPPVLQTITDTKNTYYLLVNDEVVNNCAMPCDNNIFERNEIVWARSWVLVWSALCFCSTLFTILTFLIETSRFRYPERPIIFLSGCYLIVALAYLIGSASQNDSIVCKPLKNGLMQTREYLVQGVEHIPCTLLFMMIYFFGMSSSIWWVVLTLTWFLAAGLKWGHEAIENISSYFHLAAWAIPGVKLIAVLWLQKVDADILSGVCYTGLRNINLMRGFVLVPLFFYLILGSCFLLAGFVSLFRIRNVMKHEGNKTDKLEKFMVRIGVFSILYMVPAIIVICCHFYEQSSYSKWIDFWLKRNFLEFNLQPDYVTSLYENDRSALIFTLFMIKYAMLLIVGITSGFWIWSHKTISSWKRFFERLFNCFNILHPKYKNEAAV